MFRTETSLKINNNEYNEQAIINELQPSPVSITFSSTSNSTNEDFILNWKCIQCCSVIQVRGANFAGFNQLYFANDTLSKNRPYYIGLNDMYAISFYDKHWTVGNIISDNVVISQGWSENMTLAYIRNNHTKPCPGRDNQWEEIINNNRIISHKLSVGCYCEYLDLPIEV